VEFEYDPAKSERNRHKHGIDFAEAASLWLDPRALELELEYKEEPRFALIARLDNPQQPKVWTAIFTRRSGKLRIISVRRARADEIERYEQEQGEDS
jgi:uncharacterized protein